MSVSSPMSLRNGLGRSGVLSGQSRVPPPPARTTAYTRSGTGDGDWHGHAALVREGGRLVGPLPGEVVIGPTEMAVGGRRLVDGPARVQRLDDARGPQVEVLLAGGPDSIVGNA